MKFWKYAGLCAAGSAVNFACLPLDWLFCYLLDSFCTVSIGLFIAVGIVLCIGSGFAHVAFLNVIRKNLMITTKWYFLAAFLFPLVLSGLGVILAFSGVFSGWDGLGKALTLFFISIGIGASALISSISAVLVNQFLGVHEPDENGDSK